MNLSEIIEQLTQERAKIDAALQALGEVSNEGERPKRRGRPPGSSRKAASTSGPSVGVPKKRRTMSAAARKLISEAQKKRWAAQKRAAKRG
jgi:hypothetical protein